MADKRTLAGHRRSHFGLLSHFESIIYLDPEVSHGAFNFCMAQEQLNRAQVLGAPMDQRRFRSSHGVRTKALKYLCSRRDIARILSVARHRTPQWD
uniref:Uncharacterized protein n=1 Tax=Burkholderia sp. (strain CCGE1003) TaxID=640512 RepID=E1T9Q7_BURSG